MGISRDSRHKRRLTGGRMPIHKKKRQYESGRPAANTKLGETRIREVRAMGGKIKHRALRLNTGNYNWASEGVAFKTKVLNVVYNASNNELVRTNTLVKNTIIRVDATPFKKYIVKHYFGSEEENFNLNFNWENKGDASDKKENNKHLKRRQDSKIEPKVQEQIMKGQILACISSRPGQSGRADGYILEGKELEFYLKKLEKK